MSSLVNGSRSAAEVSEYHNGLRSPVFLGATKFEPDSNTKNILITGGAGFIASWVVRHLTLTYPTAYRVICFDKVDYCASLKNTKCLENCPNFEFVYGDITDQQAVLRVLKQHRIDTIMHFAAMSHVDLSFGNSFAFTKTNVEGTHVMLEAAVKLGIRKFIHVSTDEVNGETKYGDPDLLEDSILAPTNPYAASKAAAEMYVNAYAKSFKLPCIIVRSNNVYGPHQYPEKIIPKFSCLLDRGQPLILHGSGKNTRRYLFAGDAADAFDTILHKGQIGEIYNVDSVDELSNIDLAHRMLQLYNIPASESVKWIQHVHDRPFNDLRYAVDARKLKSLGWRQKTSFEEGLRITVEWYRTFGRMWWGNLEGVLTAFPQVANDGHVWREDDPRKPRATPLLEKQQEKLVDSSSGYLSVPQVQFGGHGNGLARHLAPNVLAPVDGVSVTGSNKSENARKRARESEGKENESVDTKRQLIGDTLVNEEVLR